MCTILLDALHQFEEMIVDNCCMQMVSRPQQFDVMGRPESSTFHSCKRNISPAFD